MSVGVEDVRQPHEPDGHVPGVLGDELDRRRIARARGLPHVETGDRDLVAAGQLEHGGRPPRGHPLAAHGTERSPRRDGLPVTPLPARAEGPVGIDLEVPDLGTEAVGSAQHAAPGDDAATDAGAERDQEHLALSVRRAVGELGHDRGVGVVVDDRREPDRGFQALAHRCLQERRDVG